MPLSGGGVVECYVAGLLRPPYDEAAPVGGFEPETLPFENPYEVPLVLPASGEQLVSDDLRRSVYAQREAGGLETNALSAQVLQ